MASFGPALRRTRQEKGISLDEIAGETRLSKRYLLALEDEAIHKLPGGTYNRAYLRSYASYLGLDTERLIREYSQEEAHQTEIGQLRPQPDILTSIGKAVESRQGTSAKQRWNVNWQWLGDRERKIAALAGLALVAVLLVSAAVWLGLRSFGDADVTTASVAEREMPAKELAPAPDRVVTLPPDEAPEQPRPVPPSPAAPAAGEVTARTETPAPAPTPAPPAVAPRPEAATAKAAPPPAAVPRPPAATAKPRPAARTTKPLRLSVTASGVGTNVVDKRLVGESDTFAVGTRVTFWTRIAGGRSGDTVNHVWFHDGDRIGTTSLRIGSADWRTQSRQLLTPGGEWAVEARDAEGRVLVRHKFRAAAR
jgi:cytoskeleton protein RodZ